MEKAGTEKASTAVELAAERLRAGEPVSFPTETVYGLGADALNERAVRKIFALKGRPADHPLIVHLAPSARLEAWAQDPPEAARRLAERFWPGPLTLILHKHPRVPHAVTGGQDTVGLRVPAHPVAQALLEAFGSGLAAPSANRFGKLSPTTVAHVQSEFPGLFVLDGGPCTVGLESTIFDLSGERARLLRPGAVSKEALEEVLGATVAIGGKDAPKAPGTLASHYAPMTPLRLLPTEGFEGALRALEGPLAVLARRPRPKGLEAGPGMTAWLELPQDPEAYGRALYAALRELDTLGARLIVAEEAPTEDCWAAVCDRLTRAAQQAS